MHDIVRPAEPADAMVLVHLEQTARSGVVDARGGAALLAEEPVVSDWTTVVDSPDHRVFVATIDDVVIGYLLLDLTAEATARVRQVFVEPDARELGFGDGLLAAAIDAARAAGATTIESFALPGDRDTKNLYERAGLTARKLIVARRLVDDHG